MFLISTVGNCPLGPRRLGFGRKHLLEARSSNNVQCLGYVSLSRLVSRELTIVLNISSFSQTR